MKKLFKAIVSNIFLPLKHYHTFMRSQTNRVRFADYVTFWLSANKQGGYTGQSIKIAK